MKILIGLAAALSLHAEFLSISITVSGMDCASCVTGLETKLKRLRGVKSVELKPETNLALIQLAAGNSLLINRIRDEIKGVGFTPKDARITARGKATQEQAVWAFTLEGTNQRFLLSPIDPGISSQLEPGNTITIDAVQATPTSPSTEPILEIKSVLAQRK